MIKRAPAKINLGLHVKHKRDDRFHELETVFYEVPLNDFIELIPSDKDSFYSYNNPIPGDPDKNLCLTALRLMRSKNLIKRNYDIHLLKNIPIGAGLGGGSSDAVAVLKALREIETVEISDSEFLLLAAELGSDCPFFCMNSAALGAGRGEVLDPIDFNLSGKFLHLIYPDIHISTADAYGSLDLNKTTKSSIVFPEKVEDWKSNFVNDFENGLFQKHPDLLKIKIELYSSGAFYASMSGSGSSVYGVFTEKPLKKLFAEEGYSEWILDL